MKFAQVGYGSQGQGGEDRGGYTYIVNDNVRSGDRLTPIAHAVNGKAFVTTGKVLPKGIKVANASGIPEEKITEAVRPKDLGVERKGKTREEYEKLAKGTALAEYVTNPKHGEQKIADTPKQNEYLGTYTGEKKSGETFNSYSKRFMEGN